MHLLSLLIWGGICFAVAGMSAEWAADEVAGWYRTLVTPSIAPPTWVFGPVWTVLYTLMAVAAWQVWLTDPSTLRTEALALFLVQLGFNLAWTWIFFRRHAIGAALAEVVMLWIAIAATTLAFGKVMQVAGLLMVPYLAWVTFAVVLNAAFWRLNPAFRPQK